MSVGPLGISEKTIYEVCDAIQGFEPPSKTVMTFAAAGFAAGVNCGMDLTEEIRKELGLGGQLFGWFVVVPFCSVIGVGAGCCVGAGIEQGVGKVASVIAKSF